MKSADAPSQGRVPRVRSCASPVGQPRSAVTRTITNASVQRMRCDRISGAGTPARSRKKTGKRPQTRYAAAA
jgi:hypothetical protein